MSKIIFFIKRLRCGLSVSFLCTGFFSFQEKTKVLKTEEQSFPREDMSLCKSCEND